MLIIGHCHGLRSKRAVRGGGAQFGLWLIPLTLTTRLDLIQLIQEPDRHFRKSELLRQIRPARRPTCSRSPIQQRLGLPRLRHSRDYNARKLHSLPSSLDMSRRLGAFGENADMND